MKFDECKFPEVRCFIDQDGAYYTLNDSPELNCNSSYVQMSWGKWKGQSMPYTLVDGKLSSEILDRATKAAYKDLVADMRADYRVLQTLLKDVENV